LLARLNVARADVLAGHGQGSIASLRAVAKEADDLGFKDLAAECSVNIGEALLEGHELEQAQKELLSALRVSDKLGLRPLSAGSNALLGRLARGSKNAGEADRYQSEAQRILAEIYKEANTDSIRSRKDLAAIAAPPR
jgi:hypothetical protein